MEMFRVVTTRTLVMLQTRKKGMREKKVKQQEPQDGYPGPYVPIKQLYTSADLGQHFGLIIVLAGV